MPIITETPRTKAQFADFVFDMNMLNPNGFRMAPKRGTNNTLVHFASVVAGYEKLDRGEASSRSKRRRESREWAKQTLRKQREEFGNDGTPPRYQNLGSVLRSMANG